MELKPSPHEERRENWGVRLSWRRKEDFDNHTNGGLWKNIRESEKKEKRKDLTNIE